MAASRPCRATLAHKGDTGPPGGVPASVGNQPPWSRRPLVRQALICRLKGGAACRVRTKAAWSRRAKHWAMSAASPHFGCWLIGTSIAPLASQGLRPGRKPSLLGSHWASPAGSRAWATQLCWARSARVGIPKGRCSVVPAWGMKPRRTGDAVSSRCRGCPTSSRSGGVSLGRPQRRLGSAGLGSPACLSAPRTVLPRGNGAPVFGACGLAGAPHAWRLGRGGFGAYTPGVRSWSSPWCAIETSERWPGSSLLHPDSRRCHPRVCAHVRLATGLPSDLGVLSHPFPMPYPVDSSSRLTPGSVSERHGMPPFRTSVWRCT
jgi:hypothetical protein